DPAFAGEGTDRFYRVLEEEILPHIEGRLRVDPARRTLVGHSSGGVMAWYTAFRHAPPASPLFSGIVAADCGFDEAHFTYQRWAAERSPSLPIRLYSSRASFNGALQGFLFDTMHARVGSRHYEALELTAEVLQTDHGGAVYPSFEHGLDLILEGAR